MDNKSLLRMEEFIVKEADPENIVSNFEAFNLL